MNGEPDHRVDPLTGAEVVITGHRQSRPNLPSDGCPFCVGGLEAPVPYEVRSFANRWPALPERCEVVLYSPDHDAAMWELGVEGIVRVAELWAQRTESLGARSDVSYVLPFENRGAEVGATIGHPHGQIYGFAQIPSVVDHELAAETCALCPPADPAFAVVEADDWRCWVPPAATWPYELRMTTTDHLGDLPSSRHTFAGLGHVLGEGLRRLDALFGAPMPYMLWVHQRPTDGNEWPQAHVHIHVAPLLRGPAVARYVAAGELGSGVFFNPVVPEEAAATLRSR